MLRNKAKGAEWTGKQSKLLKRVNLKVALKKLKHKMMLATELEGPANTPYKGEVQDACAGDGGGPLMIPVTKNKWVLIGW